MDTRPLLLGSVLIAALCTLTPVSALAFASPAQIIAFQRSDDDQAPAPVQRDEPAHNAGVVEGHVVSVDYQRGVIGLQTPRRGRVDVVVLPSTNIQGRGESFHTIADISRGARLRIFLSEQAGHFIAQLIHLR